MFVFLLPWQQTETAGLLGLRKFLRKVSVRLIIFMLWGFVFAGFLLLLLKTMFMTNVHQRHPAVFVFKLGKCESNALEMFD